MSLYYGHDDGTVFWTQRSNDFFHTFTYPALSSTLWVIPMDLRVGHPTPVPYVGKYITEDTNITLMEHTFDKDGTITDLVLEYSIIVYEKDGTTFEHTLGSFDVSANMLPLTTRYICVVDKDYKLSDFHQNYKDIVVFYVRVRIVSGTMSGNESALTARVNY